MRRHRRGGLHRTGDLDALKAALVSQGVWVRPFRNIVYLTPAFTATPDELTTLTGAIRRVLEARNSA